MLNFIMGDKWEYDLLKRYSFANTYHHQYIYQKKKMMQITAFYFF